MKKNGHPPYQDILFVDTATGHKFVCGSTLQPKEKEVFEGKEYPVYKVPISSKSHPFFTGSQQFLDTEGRVDKFRKRYENKKIEAEKHAEVEKENKALKKQASGKKTPAKKTTAAKVAAEKTVSDEKSKKTLAKKKSDTKSKD
jgi:large subunit ribosomal protein L31